MRLATGGVSQLADEELFERVSTWGYVPAALREDDALQAAVVPALRQDLVMWEAWHAQGEQPALTLDVCPGFCSAALIMFTYF